MPGCCRLPGCVAPPGVDQRQPGVLRATDDEKQSRRRRRAAPSPPRRRPGAARASASSAGLRLRPRPQAPAAAPARKAARTPTITMTGLTSRSRWRRTAAGRDVSDDVARPRAREQHPDHQPVEQQSDERHRPEVPHEISVADTRERADQHVLRIAGDRGDAADVRRRRHRQQVGQRRHAPSGECCKRRTGPSPGRRCR